ncbi:MAG TPA: AMP-binding protein [Bryobacteraceae bacterium]|jgi:long-chain acyl-CoA synthetase|nr:AMP-binding protein [Bryobacteraceae bacterium]
MPTVADDDLPLQRMYRWERERAAEIFLTQPIGGGKVRDWTWSEAIGEVRRAAAYLKAQNWAPGSRVAILSKNCAWWILADLAIWMAGHVSVPIYPSLKPQTARQILEHSESQACFLGATDEEMVPGIPASVCTIRFPTAARDGSGTWDDLIRTTLPLSECPMRRAEELSTIIYTSGTTGTAKGVMHSFAAFTYNANIISEMLGMAGDQRVLSYLPLAHIVERVGVEALTVLLGSRIFFTEGLDTFLADLQRAQPTIFLSVPRLLLKFQQRVFAKVPRHRLDMLFRVPIVTGFVKRNILRQMGMSTVRYAACGAAPLPVDILLWFRELGLNLVEGYGMTETLITHLPAPGTIRPGYVGGPMKGVDARRGESNELQLRSPMNMLGYYKDPLGTGNSFLPDGFFQTGDICEIAADGQLKIVGRIKEQFKTSKGKYVAPAPIESKLIAHSEVEACCLMGAGLPSPFAVILLSEEARQRCADPQARAALENSLRIRLDEVNAQLDPHERVAFIAIVDGPWTVGNGLMTPTLKLRRPVLESRYQSLVDGWRAGNQQIVWESAP